MPLSKEHKKRTRARIINAAATLFRQKGYDRVGIDDVMAAAGLTHGGFYNHFRSKKQLLAAVLEGPHRFNRMLAERGEMTQPQLLRAALKTIGVYLDPAHTQDVAETCPMVSLARDAARGGKAARRALTGSVRDLAGELSRSLTKGRRGDDPRALTALALCVGAVSIARVSDRPDFAASVLTAARRAAVATLTAPAR